MKQLTEHPAEISDATAKTARKSLIDASGKAPHGPPAPPKPEDFIRDLRDSDPFKAIRR